MGNAPRPGPVAKAGSVVARLGHTTTALPLLLSAAPHLLRGRGRVRVRLGLGLGLGVG